MQLQQDSAGHWYGETQNLRVTFIPAADRDASARWTDSDVIRIQAYRDAESHSLHQGAEIPVRAPEDIGGLVAAICEVYTTAKTS